MSGELHSLDDFLAVQEFYERSFHPGERRQYLLQLEHMWDDLLGFAQKHALAGYNMGEWRSKVFVPFDSEYNRMVSDYSEAIEAAQDGVFSPPKFREQLALSGRRPLENAYYRELEDA